MYMDEYVISGLIIVALTCAVVGVISFYGWKHIKQDMEKSQQES